MENRRAPRTHFVATLVYFGLTATTAFVLLLTALVVWLSDVTGSVIAAALLVGGFFAVISLLIYLLALRDAVEHLREQAETVYEVAHAARIGYEWISEKVLLFMKLRSK